MQGFKDTGDRWLLIFGACGLLILAAAIAVLTGARGGAAGASGGEALRVEQGCVLMQSTHYLRCGHSVTRRLEAPQALLGAALADAEAHYADWQLQSFQPLKVEMSRDIRLHCPAHYVLMPDEAGVLSVFQNRYGDGLAYVRGLEMTLAELPEAEREEARVGIGFDTLEALETWLETFES